MEQAGQKRENGVPKETLPAPKKASQPKTCETPSDDEEEDEEAQIQTLLKSLGQGPGYGDRLQELLPREYSSRSDVVAAFLSFIYERQTIWVKKRSSKKCLTNNKILAIRYGH